jgi:thiamine-phosphate pyrophosphorylase
MNKICLKGLYAITDTRQREPEILCQQVEAALQGGVTLIQYRDKSLDPVYRRECATRMLALTARYDACLLINDDVQLAKEIGAHGVHLGQSDTPIAEARQVLGQEQIIGITCHDQLPLARAAQQAGADYVAFGRFFPSATKPHAVPAPLELIQQAQQELDIPIAAIGGITLQNALPLIHSGAHMLAVVEGLFGQDDIRGTAQAFQRLFEEAPRHERIALRPGGR